MVLVVLVALSLAALHLRDAWASDALEVRRDPVVVLDLDTGAELWTARPTEQLSYLGAVPGRDVVVATAGTCDSAADARVPEGLVAFDAATGRKRWENTSTDVVLATMRSMATYVYTVVPVDARGVVVTAGETGIHAFNAEDGTGVWSRANDEVPLGVSEVSVFAANRQDGSSEVLRAIDRRTGRVQWEHTGWQAPLEIAAADRRHVVVATGETHSSRRGQVTVVVLDARTGIEESHASMPATQSRSLSLRSRSTPATSPMRSDRPS
jgi:outer membrane protein assembly factor BamB